MRSPLPIAGVRVGALALALPVVATCADESPARPGGSASPEETTSSITSTPTYTAYATPEVDTASPGETGEQEELPLPEPTPRRILVVIADDLGVDSFGPWADIDRDGTPDDGREYASTPRLSDTCRSGVRFTQTWSAPTCSPARANMLTGRHGFRTGAGFAFTPEVGIPLDEPTIPRLLDEHPELGFAHANIGKWHLGETEKLGGDYAPNTMGWSHYAGHITATLRDYEDWDRTENGVTELVTDYATTVTVDDAITWLDEVGTQRPWLLWLAFNAPHRPYHAPPEDLHDRGELSTDPDEIDREPLEYFRATITAMDTEYGRLLDWLAENGHDDVTVIFVGDNGTYTRTVEPPYNAEHSKGSLYQGGIHVPLCIAGPDVVEPGRDSDELVHVVDLFGTMLELAGLDLAADLPADRTFDSASLVPYMLDPLAEAQRSWVFAESFGSGNESNDGQAIRDGTYKLIRWDDGREALYDLTVDPYEQQDLLVQETIDDEAMSAYESLAFQADALLATE